MLGQRPLSPQRLRQLKVKVLEQKNQDSQVLSTRSTQEDLATSSYSFRGRKGWGYGQALLLLSGTHVWVNSQVRVGTLRAQRILSSILSNRHGLGQNLESSHGGQGKAMLLQLYTRKEKRW